MAGVVIVIALLRQPVTMPTDSPLRGWKCRSRSQDPGRSQVPAWGHQGLAWGHQVLAVKKIQALALVRSLAAASRAFDSGG